MLKPGVNVIATNIYCGWRDCGIRGPAETRAIRFADGTSAPLAKPWKYQEVADGWIGPQLPWGSVHGITLDSQRHDPARRSRTPFAARSGIRASRTCNFANTYTPALLAMMGEWRRQFDDPELPFLLVQLPGYGAGPDAADRGDRGPTCAKRSGKRRLPTRTPPSR